MDIPSLPYQTEAFDAAYSSYVGYMIVEMLHSNAILRAFVHILDGLPKNVQTDEKRVSEPRFMSQDLRFKSRTKIQVFIRQRMAGILTQEY